MNLTIKFFIGLCCIANITGLSGSDQKGPADRYSPLVHWIMSRAASSNSLQQYARKGRHARPLVESNSIHTDLFYQAQEEIGIAKEDRLPIIDSTEQNNLLAATTDDRIKVFPHFNKIKYGAQRVVALHESFHHKYHDPVYELWLIQNIIPATLASAAASTIGLAALSSRYIPNKTARIATYIASPIVSIISNLLISGVCMDQLGCLPDEKNATKNNHFKEHRADTQAVLHANCHKCVSEYDEAAGDSRSPEYLSHEELASYASRFKKENKVCSYHQSSED